MRSLFIHRQATTLLTKVKVADLQPLRVHLVQTLRLIRQNLTDSENRSNALEILTALSTAVAIGRKLTRPAQDPAELPDLSDEQQALAELFAHQSLPRSLWHSLGDLYCDLAELGIATPEPEHEKMTDAVSEDKHIPVDTKPSKAVGGGADRLELSTATLYQIRRQIFPPERMLAGIARRTDNGCNVEAVYDVTGPATLGHCVADPDKLTRVLLDADASGTFFDLWAHSHPGEGATATFPSGEDRDSYQKRVQAGDRHLVGAVFAGGYVRFFGAPQRVVIIGDGLEPVAAEKYLYEFIA